MKQTVTLALIILMIIRVCDAQPLSGTYTIGGAGADYQTINAAASHLSLSGVNGPVTFNIAPGVYQENFVVGPVQGASATNTITFQSTTQDSSDVVILHPSTTTSINNYLLRLNGASYTTFRYLTLQRTDSNDYSQVVDIINGSHFINFYNNRIIGTPANSSATFKSLVYGPNNSSMSNIIFENNRFENGSYGVFLLGIGALICCIDQGNMVLNNHFVNQYHCAIMLSYQFGPLIEGNIIESNSTANGFGIYTFYADNNLRILRNKVSILNGKGIYVHNSNLAGNPVNLVANNFVSVGGNISSDGIFLDNSRFCNVFFNSVNIFNSNAGSSAFRINGTICSSNDLYNNVLANTGGGYSAYVSSNTITPFGSSNYNNFYTTGSQTAFWQASGNQATLAAYRTASSMEQQSVAIDPMFVSNTDLHSRSVQMNNLGTVSYSSATAPVLTDIDGDVRCQLTPDIGADEYSAGDLKLLLVDTIHSLCAGGNPSIKVSVVNTVPYLFDDTFNIIYQFDNLPADTFWFQTQIPPGDTIEVYASGNSSLPASGQYVLKVFLDYYWDVDRSNDTLSVSVTISAPFTVDLGADFTLCSNEEYLLMPAGSYTSYHWHDNSTANSWLADGSVMNTGINQIWLFATNDRNCTNIDSVEAEVFKHPEPVIAVSPSFIGYIGNDTLTIICQKFLTQFSCGSFSSYVWSSGSMDSVFVIMPNMMAIGHHTSYVTVTDNNNCHGVDSLWFYVDDCQSVEEIISTDDIRVFPVPSRDGIINIELTESVTDSELIIFNITGEKVLKRSIDTASGQIIQLDLSDRPNGVYLLKHSTGKGFVVRKLLLQKY